MTLNQPPAEIMAAIDSQISDSKLRYIFKKLARKTHVHPLHGCWLCSLPPMTSGYAQLHKGKRLIGVHRLSAHVFLGLDLEDHKAITGHLCEGLHPDYKRCWNPSHLEIIDHAQNKRIADALRKQRKESTT